VATFPGVRIALLDLGVLYQIAETRDMTYVESLSHLYFALSGVLEQDIEGAIVNLGCNAGHTSHFYNRSTTNMACNGVARYVLHVYDSFEGCYTDGYR
jgi:O-methyltransferase